MARRSTSTTKRVRGDGRDNAAAAEGSYVDAKDRRRWRRNDEIGQRVRELGEYLIIGGYPPAHAARYARLAHTISRLPESIDSLAANGRLETIAGVGGVITGYLEEIVRTGSTAKFDDDQYGPPPPRSVLELTAIDGLGPKTAKLLYQEHGIDGLEAIAAAAVEGRLGAIRGIGPALIAAVEARCRERGLPVGTAPTKG